MKIFIPGGTGFLGSHVAPLLASRGHKVISAGRSPKADVYLDATSVSAEELRQLLSKIQPEATLNLVGSGLSDSTAAWPELVEVNSAWPATLAQALRDSTDSSLIHAASSTELLTSENGHYESAYSHSRAAGTQALQEVQWKSTESITVAYVHNTFGPEQPPRRLIKWIVNNTLAETPFHLAYPDRVRDFIYIDDVAESISQLVEGGETLDRVHIGTGHGTSLRALAHMVADLTGCDAALMTEDSPVQDPFAVSIADPALLQRIATIALEDGLSHVIAAVRKGVE